MSNNTVEGICWFEGDRARQETAWAQAVGQFENRLKSWAENERERSKSVGKAEANPVVLKEDLARFEEIFGALLKKEQGSEGLREFSGLVAKMCVEAISLTNVLLQVRVDNFEVETRLWKRVSLVLAKFHGLIGKELDVERLIVTALSGIEDALSTLTITIAQKLQVGPKNRSVLASVKLLKNNISRLGMLLRLKKKIEEDHPVEAKEDVEMEDETDNGVFSPIMSLARRIANSLENMYQSSLSLKRESNEEACGLLKGAMEKLIGSLIAAMSEKRNYVSFVFNDLCQMGNHFVAAILLHQFSSSSSSSSHSSYDDSILQGGFQQFVTMVRHVNDSQGFASLQGPQVLENLAQIVIQQFQKQKQQRGSVLDKVILPGIFQETHQPLNRWCTKLLSFVFMANDLKIDRYIVKHIVQMFQDDSLARLAAELAPEQVFDHSKIVLGRLETRMTILLRELKMRSADQPLEQRIGVLMLEFMTSPGDNIIREMFTPPQNAPSPRCCRWDATCFGHGRLLRVLAGVLRPDAVLRKQFVETILKPPFETIVSGLTGEMKAPENVVAVHTLVAMVDCAHFFIAKDTSMCLRDCFVAIFKLPIYPQHQHRSLGARCLLFGTCHMVVYPCVMDQLNLSNGMILLNALQNYFQASKKDAIAMVDVLFVVAKLGRLPVKVVTSDPFVSHMNELFRVLFESCAGGKNPALETLVLLSFERFVEHIPDDDKSILVRFLPDQYRGTFARHLNQVQRVSSTEYNQEQQEQNGLWESERWSITTEEGNKTDESLVLPKLNSYLLTTSLASNSQNHDTNNNNKNSNEIEFVQQQLGNLKSQLEMIHQTLHVVNDADFQAKIKAELAHVAKDITNRFG